MKKIRFAELFNFQPKSKILANKGKEFGKYPFYTSSPVISKYSDEFQYHGEHLIFGTGGTPSLHYIKSAFSTSSHCSVAKPSDRELFNPKYVYYYIQSNIHILDNGFKGAGLKNISESFIENLIIPFPSFSVQNQIVSVMDKAINIIEHSNKLIEKLEELKESIYFSLFGSRSLNYDTWDLVKLEQLASEKKGSMRTGPFGSNLLHDEFLPKGDVLVFRLDNVASNYFKKSDRFITKSKYESLKNYRVYPRDLLIALMGTGTTGKSAVVPDEIPLAINTKHLAAVTLNSKIANPYYVSSAIQFNPSIINQIELKNKGAVIPGINLKVVKGLKLKVPSINQQNHFEKIIRKIEEAVKAKILIHAQHAELLMETISHYAFQGTLKTNLAAFSIDDRVVDHVEKEYNKKESLSNVGNQLEEIKQIVQSVFKCGSFTFKDLEVAVRDSGVEIEYEYPLAEKRMGLKNFVFEAVTSNGTKKPLFKQEFELDKNRDAEKGIDNSRIIFSLNV